MLCNIYKCLSYAKLKYNIKIILVSGRGNSEAKGGRDSFRQTDCRITTMPLGYWGILHYIKSDVFLYLGLTKYLVF